MKESYNVEIVNTKSIMSKKQQMYFRNQLKTLLEKESIISICLDDRSIYIEYNKDKLDRASLKNILLKYEFPVGEFIIESNLEAHAA